MPTRLIRQFDFQAAHDVPTFPEGHPCKRLHGHTYTVEVVLEGEVDPELGYLIDFGDVKRAVQPIIDRLDHRYLNEIPGLEIPTAEHIARWVYERAAADLPSLTLVRVRETAKNVVEYSPQG